MHLYSLNTGFYFWYVGHGPFSHLFERVKNEVLNGKNANLEEEKGPIKVSRVEYDTKENCIG